MSKEYEIYKKTNDIIQKYSYAAYVISFDVNTICPKKNKEYAYENMNYFSGEIYKLKTSDEYYNCLNLIMFDLHKLDVMQMYNYPNDYLLRIVVMKSVFLELFELYQDYRSLVSYSCYA